MRWWFAPASALVIALVGAAGFAASGGERASISFLAAFGLTLAVVGFATTGVMVLGTWSPSVALLTAMTNYALTVVLFVVVVDSLNRASVDVPAVGVGAACSVVPYLLWQFHAHRVRPLTEAERAAIAARPQPDEEPDSDWD